MAQASDSQDLSLQATDAIRDAAVTTLVAEAQAENCPDDVFDDAIYDASIEGQLDTLNSTDDEEDQEREIETAEDRASRINNTGFAGQIEYLLSGYKDLEEGMADIRKIIAEAD